MTPAQTAERAVACGTSRFGVLVVDDHEVIQWGYRMALAQSPRVSRCLTAATSAEALELVARYDVRVALIDVFLGREAGTALARTLSRSMRVLLLSTDGYASPAAVTAARAQGVVGKSWPVHRVVETVQRAADGRALRPGPSASRPVTSMLSTRETEIVSLMAEGATNSEIALELDLSPWTVKQHSSSLYRKLEARNRAEAVSRAQQFSLID